MPDTHHPRRGQASEARNLMILAAAVMVLALSLVFVVPRMLRATDGVFVYCLDDAYIHLSMARNLVQHGTYGVTRHAFSASSSSPLWTLLLAGAFALTGVHDGTAFVLGCLVALGSVVLAYIALRKSEVGGWRLLLSLLLVSFAAPLPALVSSGMEQSLHVLVTIGLVFSAQAVLSRAGRAPSAALVVFGMLSVAARYESVFLCLRPSGSG